MATNEYVVIWRPRGGKVLLFSFKRVILAKLQLSKLRKETGKKSGYIWDMARFRKVEPGYMSRANRKKGGRKHGRR